MTDFSYLLTSHNILRSLHHDTLYPFLSVFLSLFLFHCPYLYFLLLIFFHFLSSSSFHPFWLCCDYIHTFLNGKKREIWWENHLLFHLHLFLPHFFHSSSLSSFIFLFLPILLSSVKDFLLLSVHVCKKNEKSRKKNRGREKGRELRFFPFHSPFPFNRF